MRNAEETAELPMRYLCVFIASSFGGLGSRLQHVGSFLLCCQALWLWRGLEWWHAGSGVVPRGPVCS